MNRARLLRLLWIALACLYWLTSSACFLCGNGEPICGAKGNPNGGGFDGGDQNPGSSSAPQTVNNYYREQPGYTCTPAGSSTPVPSYRNQIQYAIGASTALLTGDACSASSTIIPASALTFSLDSTLIGYQEGIYKTYSQPPPPASTTHVVVEAWCQPVDANLNPAMEVMVFTSDGTGQPTSFVTQGEPSEKLEGQRTNATGLRTYLDGTIFQLSIDLTNLPSNPPTYPGQLDSSPTGFYLGDLNCRILP